VIGDSSLIRLLLFFLPLFVSLCLLPAAHSQSSAEAPEGPLFLLRPVASDQVPVLMERARPGVLVQMPLSDFLEKVKRAGRNGDGPKAVPRLLEASYRAVLKDNALHGSGQWKVNNPDKGMSILRVQPLNLALRRLRFENRDALLADFDGKSPGLLLDENGQHAVSIEWTARGERTPDGLLFDLRLPACALASLELDLPAGYAVSVLPDGCLASGPHPADEEALRRWRIGFPGRSQVHLTVRQAQEAGPPPLLLASQQTVQRLTPDSVEADFHLDLRALPQGVQELRCECDPHLRPYEVTAPGLETWRVVQTDLPPGVAGPTGPLLLTVRLREPLLAGTIHIRCLASLEEEPAAKPQRAAWVSPGLRVTGAVPRGEALTLRFHPALRLEDWKPGAFRLVKATTEADGTQVWTLQGGALGGDRPAPGPDQDRPSARLRTQAVEFLARQMTLWQVGPEKAAVKVQLTVEVMHGRLFELPLLLPAAWDVDRVETNPKDLLRTWGVRKEGGRSTLVVELQRPLTPAARPSGGPVAPQLRLELRPARDLAGEVLGKPDEVLALPFPSVVPQGARLFEGALAIDFDQLLYEAAPETAAVPGTPEGEGPWGQQTPDFFYPYRGDGVQGVLRLRRRPPRVRARCSSEVVLTSGRAALVAHLFLYPVEGSTDTIDLAFSAPLPGKWQWRAGRGSNEVRRFERLPTVEGPLPLGALGAGPIAAAVQLAAPPGGERWQLSFARPLREPVALHGSCELRPSLHGGRWEVPLLTVLGAGWMDGEVKLFLGGADVVQVDSEGLHEARPATAPGPRGRAPSPWRTFSYSAPPVALTLRGQALTADRSTEAAADQALLTTYVEPGGRQLHHFRFQLWNWRQRTVPVRLPPEARLLAVRVDGRWVAQLPPVQTVEDSPVVELPAPVPDGADPAGEKGMHRYEILYALDGPGWWLWARLQADPPGLPVATLAYRHTWCLPPGLAPLLDGRQRSLPGAAGRERGPADWERLPRLGVQELWRGRALPFPGRDRQLQQEERMEAAGAALAHGKAATLGELLDRLVFEHLKEQGPLVLDTVAIEEAGLSPSTRLPAAEGVGPPWERLGLAYVACPVAPLLTTRRQRESWQAAGQADPLAEPIEAAIAEAAVLGHDSSARFRTALDWLRRGQSDEPSNGPRSVLASFQAEFPWTEWEPVAGTQDGSALLMVRQEIVPGLGMALAAVLCLAFWRTGRGGNRRRLAFLLLWLGAGGLAALWLPTALQALAWWPLVAGSVIAFVWYLWSAGRGKADAAPRPAPEPSGAAAGLLALVLFTGLAGNAAAPSLPSAVREKERGEGAPATVYLVPGPADAPEKATVLAPADLLERLDALAADRRGRRSHPPGLSEAVLIRADYQGGGTDVPPVGGAAELRAVYQVWCPTDEPVSLALPLDGVQLQEDILLDGARAYVTAARPPQAGYVLRVKERGLHTVRVRFRVPVQVQGDERLVSFTGPGLLQNHLTFELPAAARYAQAVVGQGPARGAQRVDADPRGGLRLEADLGRPSPPQHQAAPLLIRWRQEPVPPRRPVVHVREAYLWNLRADASTLIGVLRWSVSQAPITSLTINLPEALEVQSVEAGPAGNLPVRLRGWRVLSEGGRRQLRLELTGPLLGELQTTVQLVPAHPFGATAELPLPAPQADPLPRPTRADHLLAYRQDGVEAAVIDSRFVTGLDSKKDVNFAEHWQKLGRTEPMPPARAFTISRLPGQAPLLRVRLAVPAARVQAVQDVTWRIGPQQAEFRLGARLTALNEDLVYLEWEAPAAETITSVSGPDIHHWTRSGARLQVWLQRTLAATEVQIAGRLPLQAGPKGEPTVLTVPPMRLTAVPSQRTYVRFQAAGDVTLAPAELHGLLPLPDPRASDQDLGYVAVQPAWKAVLAVRPAAVAADVKVLTLIEVRERQLVFVARVEYQVRQGELRRAAVRLRNWPGEAEVEPAEPGALAGPPTGGTPVPRGSGEERTWTVALPPGVTGRYRLTLTGSMPLEKAAGGIALPDVSVPRSASLERWLMISGRELAVDAAQGLTPSADAERDLRPWPGEANRLRRAGGQVWHVEPGEWDRRLQLRPHAGGSPVQVFLTEQAASVADGRRWSHQVVWWLHHEANTDLTVQLPAGARVVSVTVDEAAITPLQPSPRHVWLPLPGEAGVRSVRLRWVYDEEAERLSRPLLARPRLEGAADGPVLWTVQVPVGYQASAAGDAEPLSAGGMDVRRAEALLRLSALLAEQGRDPAGTDRLQLAGVQRRFYECCRWAAQELAEARTLLEEDLRRPPLTARLEQLHESNNTLAERLQKLLEQNRQLAQAHGFEELRARAERQARAGASPDSLAAGQPFALLPPAAADADRAAGPPGGPLPERGTPLHWQGDADTAAPRVALTGFQSGQVKRALAGSLLLVVVLLVAWVVAQYPGVLGWVRAFWPEQMALLGCAGWQTLGLNLVVVFLILLGVCARLIALAQVAFALLRRWTVPPTGGTPVPPTEPGPPA
jgi:hypothetical protein